MNAITLNSNTIANMTAVSNIFIDTYMPSADGSYVKVYLYLLRSLGQPAIDITIPHIADILECTERDVIRALCYWERTGLISVTRDGDDINGITLNNPECVTSCTYSPNTTSTSSATSISSPISTSSTKGSPSNNLETDVAHLDTNDFVQDNDDTLITPPLEVLMENDNFADMITVIESAYVMRPLSPKESDFIVDLYCKFQFGTCLILDLFDQCSDKLNSKQSFIPYMSKVANSWYTKGIDSSLKAREYSREYLECYTALRKAFGINNRDLSSAELKFINKWHAENGFDAQMIQTACEKCISGIGKPSLNYADSIMDAWNRNNIRTLEDVAKSDKTYQGNKSNSNNTQSKPNFYNTYTQRDYSKDDITKLELELLSR